jgi:hypothetical protein
MADAVIETMMFKKYCHPYFQENPYQGTSHPMKKEAFLEAGLTQQKQKLMRNVLLKLTIS